MFAHVITWDHMGSHDHIGTHDHLVVIMANFRPCYLNKSSVTSRYTALFWGDSTQNGKDAVMGL